MKLDDLTIAKTLDAVNQRFYDTHYQAFDGTRQFGWPGWQEVVSRVVNPTPRVLDIGCGNGRFARFLDKHQHHNPTTLYTGIDRCEKLLSNAASKTYTFSTKWINLDWSDALYNGSSPLASPKYDLIVAFGVLHHIYHRNFRLKFLDWCTNHLAQGGYFVVSAWDFGRHSRFHKKFASPSVVLTETGLELQRLEPNDFFLSFGQDATPLRYCHWLDDLESDELISRLLDKRKTLRLVDRIEQTDDLNRYWIFVDTRR